jgi:hypothetical protein
LAFCTGALHWHYTDDGTNAQFVSPAVARPEVVVTVTANASVTVPGLAPGVTATLAFQTCTVDLQHDWQPRYTKLQSEVWNEDEGR